VQAEFKTVIDAANGDPKFKTFLEDPTMSKAKKIAGLTAFCDGAGFAPVTKSFLCVVAENGRLAENQKIYDALEEYTLAAAGQVKATVTSAQALTPEQLKELTAKAAQARGLGRRAQGGDQGGLAFGGRVHRGHGRGLLRPVPHVPHPPDGGGALQARRRVRGAATRRRGSRDERRALCIKT
jgi:hypothetical protein